MSITRIDIDSDGDTLIILPYEEGASRDDNPQIAFDDAAAASQEEDPTLQTTKSDDDTPDRLPELHLKVSSKHLALASRRAKVMFAGPFKEAHPSIADGLRHWQFEPIFNPKAFQTVMNMIHGKTRETPQKMKLQQLADFAAVVDDLECHDAVWFVARIWVKQLPTLSSTARFIDIARLILITSVFNEPHLFLVTTRAAILGITDSLSTSGLPIRPKIVETIDLTRQDAIDKLITCLNAMVEDLCQSSSCNLACRSMMLGSLILGMSAKGLYSPRPTRPFHGLSLKSMVESILAFESPKCFCPREYLETEDNDDFWESMKNKRKKHGSGIEQQNARIPLVAHRCNVQRLLRPKLNDVCSVRGLKLSEFSGMDR